MDYTLYITHTDILQWCSVFLKSLRPYTILPFHTKAFMEGTKG